MYLLRNHLRHRAWPHFGCQSVGAIGRGPHNRDGSRLILERLC
jgi:hypothetical protein